MAHAPSAALSHRHQVIRQAMVEQSIDALVVTSLPNILYLTNFSGSSAVLVLTKDRLQFVTDARYVTVVSESADAPHACPGLELVNVDGSYDLTLVTLLETMPPATRIGFEAAHLAVSRHRWLSARLILGEETRELVGTEGIVERARVVKDAYELATLLEGARRLSNVAVDVMSKLRRGRRERDVALDVDWAVREAGFERAAFDTIVASGPNAALPHARPGERTLTEGDLVVLDFGGVYDSYCVDLTRTVSIGPASERARQVHAAVLDARNRAIASAAPGVSRFSVDAAARNALTEAGMANAFTHGTGHGLGIEIHEDPRVARPGPGIDTSGETLTPGMVFTIEPGAYFPGWGGVRIEDDVVVTDGGVRLLTDVPTELLEL
jgi:Xaa-Pro aminopeptidase